MENQNSSISTPTRCFLRAFLVYFLRVYHIRILSESRTYRGSLSSLEGTKQRRKTLRVLSYRRGDRRNDARGMFVGLRMLYRLPAGRLYSQSL